MSGFWVVEPCNLGCIPTFRRNILLPSTALKMEAVYASELYFPTGLHGVTNSGIQHQDCKQRLPLN
jgi:hypothetical protein